MIYDMIDKEKLISDTKERIENVRTIDEYVKYLDAMAVFGRYESVEYISMALDQCPKMSVIKTKKNGKKSEPFLKMKMTESGSRQKGRLLTGRIYGPNTISQVDFQDGEEKAPQKGGEVLCREAGKAVGSLKKAFEIAVEAEDRETVDGAIIRHAGEANMTDGGYNSICYVVRKWFGLYVFDYDFTQKFLQDYAGELPDVCKYSAKTIKALEKEFKRMKKAESLSENGKNYSGDSSSKNNSSDVLTEINKMNERISALGSQIREMNNKLINMANNKY